MRNRRIPDKTRNVFEADNGRLPVRLYRPEQIRIKIFCRRNRNVMQFRHMFELHGIEMALEFFQPHITRSNCFQQFARSFRNRFRRVHINGAQNGQRQSIAFQEETLFSSQPEIPASLRYIKPMILWSFDRRNQQKTDSGTLQCTLHSGRSRQKHKARQREEKRIVPEQGRRRQRHGEKNQS